MEVRGGKQNQMLVCLYEALGVLFLFVTVNMTAGQSYQLWAIGFVLTVNIILFGKITDSHVNPAVTLGVLIRESVQPRSKGKCGENVLFAIKIMLSQVFGAGIGAFIVTILRVEDKVGIARLCSPIGGVNCAGVNGNAGRMLAAEVIGTFFFVSINVNVIYNCGSIDLIINAMVIGFALILGLMVAAPISGGSVNPAVGFMLPVLQNLLFEIDY